MPESEIENVIIIGGGPAGYTAAIYAARANLKPLLIAGPLPGGQLMLTSDVENYPGFKNPVAGPDLMEAMREQAERVGTRYVYAIASKVDFSKPPFKIWTDNNELHQARSVIIATGAESRMMGLPQEKEFMGRGVSTCATCDGPFYKGKDVAVIGGGDSAIEEASYLARLVKSVTVIHRRDQFRASKIMQDRLTKLVNVSVLWNTTVEKILTAANKFNGLGLKDSRNGKNFEKSFDGVFVAIGHVPGTKTFEDQIDLDSEGYIRVHEGTKTNVAGIFAAGDCVDRMYRQAVTAAGMGCMAALDCERYLADIE